MCTFISASLNPEADHEKVQATFERYRFRFVDVPAPRAIPKGRRYLAHDSGHCDCGTAIGSSFRSSEPAYDPGEILKLRKSGWSETKIARWIQQKKDAESKSQRAEEDRLRAAHGDLASWTELIRAMLQTPSVTVFGLMHDFYASGPGYEEFDLSVRLPRPVGELDEANLFRLPQGVLQEWTRG